MIRILDAVIQNKDAKQEHHIHHQRMAVGTYNAANRQHCQTHICSDPDLLFQMISVFRHQQKTCCCSHIQMHIDQVIPDTLMVTGGINCKYSMTPG